MRVCLNGCLYIKRIFGKACEKDCWSQNFLGKFFWGIAYKDGRDCSWSEWVEGSSGFAEGREERVIKWIEDRSDRRIGDGIIYL